MPTSVRRVLAVSIWILIVLGAPPLSAQEATEAGGGPADIPCAEADAAVAKATGTARLDLARTLLERPCQPMPGAIQDAINAGTWPGGGKVTPKERLALLEVAVAHGYAEAETLTVRILETGGWPDGSGITLEDGILAIRALAPAMTRYRTRLLLDIHEQHTAAPVRVAVLETLRKAPYDEALLPALESYWQGSGTVQAAGMKTVGDQPEGTASDVLARLIRNLPSGPLLDWAVRLARTHPGEAVTAALKERGLQG